MIYIIIVFGIIVWLLCSVFVWYNVYIISDKIDNNTKSKKILRVILLLGLTPLSLFMAVFIIVFLIFSNVFKKNKD